MTDRGPVTRCRIQGCVVLGHFSAYGDLCPTHRDPFTVPEPGTD